MIFPMWTAMWSRWRDMKAGSRTGATGPSPSPAKKIDVFTPRAGDRRYRTQNQMISFRTTGISQNLKVSVRGYIGDYIAEGVRPSETGVMWTNIGVVGGMNIPTGRIVVSSPSEYDCWANVSD